MEKLSYYESGETSYFALRSDQRFGYCLYVPASFSLTCASQYELVTIIHGSSRTPHTYRSLFIDFAEAQRCIVLAPMFPSHIFVGDEEANYKFIRCRDIRFDLLLLAMIDEVVQRYRISGEKTLLHGFSGGAHFAHRFFYLHPERLMGLSVGAPGMVTLLDPRRDWHCGTRGMAALFGRQPDLAAMAEVPVQFVIGSEDTDTWEITIAADDPLWMEGVNDAGVTRLDRIHALRHSFAEAGIRSRYDEVDGIGHCGFEILGPVREFFADVLQAYRSSSVLVTQDT